MRSIGVESGVSEEYDPAPLASRLRVTAAGPGDIFTAAPPRVYSRRIYGGHMLAQALLAASGTVEPQRQVVSLHAYFLQQGDPRQELRYAVTRLRDGRSFSARTVEVRQGDALLMSFSASFLTERDAEQACQEPMPAVPAPETLPSLHERRSAGGYPAEGINWPGGQEWHTGSRPLDIRYIDNCSAGDGPRRCFWFRAQPIPGSPQSVQRSVLAFASDRSLLPSILQARGELHAHSGRKVASLDHAMWFHADVVAGQWLLYVQESPFSTRGMGMARGLIYDRKGVLVASVAQQGLISGQ